MTRSELPLEAIDERSKWLGGEAHVRDVGHRSSWPTAWMVQGPYALGLAFLVGGLIGAGLTGLIRRTP